MKNLLTKEAFAEWCEKQPADKTYDYDSNEDCAFSQYLGALGINASVGSCTWFDIDNHEVSRAIPRGINRAVLDGAWTFGALATRLRART